MILKNEDGNVKQSTVYSWKSGAINKPGTAAATDITGITAFAALFTPFTYASSPTRVRKPHKIKVTCTGAGYIKINGGDVITIGATTSFEASDLIIESLGVSDASGTTTMTVYLQ